jgi:Ca-activated chloride channel family protein
MRKSLYFCAALVLAFVCLQSVQAQKFTEGSLEARARNGKPLGWCPLKHTAVKAEISGFLSRVRVAQEFENNFPEKIEAVYVFPLPQMAAVDEMTMKIGERTIKGRVMRREEARRVYETAKDEGQTASLLDQERTNIFTQSIANIQPGEKITIEISYVETLKYEDGSYEFVFPTVVAPRYNPAQVKDAQSISPPIAATRAGHNVSIEVNLNAGVPIENIAAKTHEIETTMFAPNRAVVKLKNQNEIPNRDFILRFDVSGKRIEDAVLAHKDERGGFFTLILQPPDKLGFEDLTPKEIVFVLDTSGSMSGFPIEKAKEAMNAALDNLNPLDTFNLITFAGDTHVLFDKPVPASVGNLRKAQEFLATRAGGGGTEMMQAIRTSLAPSDSAGHIRIVCFMTDGVVGNDDQIIAEVQKHSNARIFAFGIGESVNRYLLDKIAEIGRGEVKYVSLTDDGSAAAKRFHERVRNPILTDVAIEWNGLPVSDVYPRKIQDLFSAKPVVIHGKYLKAAAGAIKLKGKIGGQDFVREINLNLPENEAAHDTLATLWARTRIEDLTNQSLKYNEDEEESELVLKQKTKNEIVALGLKYKLLTQFTSFVAVEEKIVTRSGKPRRVEVPVETPAGMNRNNVIDSEDESESRIAKRSIFRGRRSRGMAILNTFPVISSVTLKQQSTLMGPGVGNGSGNGIGASPVPTPVPKTISGGVVNSKASSLVAPTYPAAAKAVNASGAVNVQIVIDEQGNVISATATGGHPLLRAAAVAAAQQSKFAPTLLSGNPVKVTGIMVYNFASQNSTATVISAMAGSEVINEPEQTPPLTPEMIKRRELEAKLHPKIAELLNNLNQSKTTESSFVRSGKAEIVLRIDSLTPETLGELKKIGFEVTRELPNLKAVSGQIAIDKLSTLAESVRVKFIAPVINAR